MASKKTEDWWSGEYPELSIKNYKKMSVYMLFVKNRKPFRKENKRFREAFWIDDNCEIYEWFDLVNRTGEKFGHDHWSDTKFYEFWWVLENQEIRRVRKVWLCEPVEWGVEITYYPDFEEHKGWSVKNENVQFEDFKKYPDHSEGRRYGTVDTPDGPEDFEETFWEEIDARKTEKEWRTPLGAGITNEEQKGNHKQGSKIHNKGPEKINELWEKDHNESFEDETHEQPGSAWGKLRKRDGPNQVKLEWSGEKPILADPSSSKQLSDLAQESLKTLKNIKNNSHHSDSDDLHPSLNSLVSELNNLKKESQEVQDTPQFSLSPENPKIKELEAALENKIKANFGEVLESLLSWEKEKQKHLTDLDSLNLNDISSPLKLLAEAEKGKLDQLEKMADLVKALSDSPLSLIKNNEEIENPDEVKETSTHPSTEDHKNASDVHEPLGDSGKVPPDSNSLSSSSLPSISNTQIPSDIKQESTQALLNHVSDLISESGPLLSLLSTAEFTDLPKLLSDFSNIDSKANELANELLNSLENIRLLISLANLIDPDQLSELGDLNKSPSLKKLIKPKGSKLRSSGKQAEGSDSNPPLSTESLDINIFVNLSGGDLSEQIQDLDRKSAELLKANLAQVQDEELSKNLENFAKGLDEGVKETPGDYLNCVKSRLDLLQDLELRKPKVSDDKGDANERSTGVLGSSSGLNPDLVGRSSSPRSNELENKRIEEADPSNSTSISDLIEQLRQKDEALASLNQKLGQALDQIGKNQSFDEKSVENLPAPNPSGTIDEENKGFESKHPSEISFSPQDLADLANLAEIKKTIDDKDDEIRNLKDLLASKDKKIGELELKDNENEERLKDEQNKLQQRLEEELSKSSKELGSTSKSLELEAKDLKSKRKELESLLKDLDLKEKALESKSNELGNKSKELEKLSDELENKSKELELKSSELENKSNELENKSNELEIKSNELENKSNELENKSNELESKLNQLESHPESNPESQADIAQLNSLVEDLRSQLTKQNEDLLTKDFDLKSKDDDLRDKDFDLEQKLSELNQLKSDLEALSKDLDSAKNDLKLKQCELVDKQKENEKLSQDLESKSSDLQLLSSSESDLKSQLKSKLSELENLSEEATRLNSLNSSQQEQLEMQKKLLESSSSTPDLLKQVALDAEAKSAQLADAMASQDSLKNSLLHSQEEKNDLASALAAAQKEIDNLKLALNDMAIAHKRSQVRNVSKIFYQRQRGLFKKWLSKSQQKEQMQDVLGFSDDEVFLSDEEDEKQHVTEYKAADDMLSEENKMLIEANVIMQNYKQVEGKPEKPMSYLNIFKFLEELIVSKYETDKKDTADKRQMRTMTEFMMENLQRKFGIQSLALKFLGQFIPGFFQLFNEGHKYAVFFARLLQLFHSEPVSYSLGLYLVRVAIEFNGLVEKCDKYFNNFKITANTKDTTHGRKAYEEAGTGGLVLVSDAIEYIYNIFAGDRESGTKALELMKPELVGIEEYVIFRICHKMAKLGSTPESIFNTLDKDGGGSISSKELNEGLKRDLDLWVSESNINKLMEMLDSDGTGDLSKEEFMVRVSMKIFNEWSKKPVWTISKCSFLTAMIEVFKHNQRKLAAHLSPKFLKFNKPQLDKEEFEELFLSYEPTLTVYDINKLFTEGLEIVPGSEGISFRVAALLMSKYGLSYLKPFRIKELMENLSSRKTIVDITLSNPEQGVLKKNAPGISIAAEEVKKDKNRFSLGLPKTPISKSFSEKSQSPGRKNMTPRELVKSTKSISEKNEDSGKKTGLPPMHDSEKSMSMIGRKKSVKK